MRIGLIADTHDRLPAIRELLTRMSDAGVELILHAGDFCSPFALRPFREASLPMAGVFGRNDGDHEGLRAEAAKGMGVELYESPHSLQVGAERILLVHDLTDARVESVRAHGIVVHGHSHQIEMKHRGDALIVNPGEACGWLYGPPTAALLDLESKEVEIIKLDAAAWAR